MAIVEESTQIKYSGDGTTDQFSFIFRIIQETDLLVLLVDEDGDEIDPIFVAGFDPAVDTLNPGEYGVVINGTSGGTVYMGTPPTSDEGLYIARKQNFLQPERLNVGNLPSRVLEVSLDRLTMFVQELAAKINRAPLLKKSTSQTSVELPEPEEDFVLGWDDQGDLKNIDLEEVVEGIVDTAVDDALDAAGLPDIEAGDEKKFLEIGDPSLEAEWQSAQFTGFSARFGNAFFDINGIREAINAIFNFAYVLPGANLTTNISTALRERGDAVTSQTLSTNVTRNSDPILDVGFYEDSIAPGNIIGSLQTGDPDSGVRTQSWSGSFDSNKTFWVQVRDDGTSNSGTPQNRNVSLTFNFVYPYYFGVGVPSLTPAQVAGLTKQIINPQSSANRVFTFAVGDVFYFAYPASISALTSILDENGFENLSNFTQRNEDITGLDSTAQSYRIYEFNNPAGISGTTNYTFIR